MSPKKQSNIVYLLILSLILLITSSGFGFEVIKYFSDSSLLFHEKLGCALKYAAQQNNCKKIWIVYQIKSEPVVIIQKFPSNGKIAREKR